jgi:elongation factor Ts
MMDCKRALTESSGDIEAAKDLIKKWGLAGVEKRSGRLAKEGTIAHYIHQLDPVLPPKKGVLIELNCETDFVAKTPEFKELGRNIAMHVAAMEPQWVSRSDVPQELIEREKSIFRESDQFKGKPDHVIEKIMEGKLYALFAERGGVLLEQKYVWDESGKKTIGDLVSDYAAAVKENIGVRRFVRFAVGE